LKWEGLISVSQERRDSTLNNDIFQGKVEHLLFFTKAR